MKEIELIKFIVEQLEQKKNVMLLTVADSYKSSPGKAGFKLAITEDDKMVGTIGGGIMEHNMLQLAKEFFYDENFSTKAIKLYHSKKSSHLQSGLICGGTQSIIFHKIKIDELGKFKEQLANSSNRIKTLLALSPRGIRFSVSEWSKNKFSYYFNDSADWEYRENCGAPDTVYIIGGGHVGLAVSRAMATLDFYVITFDNRSNVFTMANNIYAEKKIITEYESVGDFIEPGVNSYVVVVTAEYPTDKAAVKSVIGKEYKYLGLMGSKSKIKKIFTELEEEGVDPVELKQIHTPIGVEVFAETPEEIAISIAAEIVKVKNKK